MTGGPIKSVGRRQQQRSDSGEGTASFTFRQLGRGSWSTGGRERVDEDVEALVGHRTAMVRKVPDLPVCIMAKASTQYEYTLKVADDAKLALTMWGLGDA